MSSLQLLLEAVKGSRWMNGRYEALSQIVTLNVLQDIHAHMIEHPSYIQYKLLLLVLLPWDVNPCMTITQ